LTPCADELPNDNLDQLFRELWLERTNAGNDEALT
jgi:hypothetical protein